MSPDVVTVGETMVLLLAEQPGPLRDVVTFRRFIAGAESNVAVGLQRLGHTSGWISRVGADEFGQAILAHLRGEGVDITRVTIADEAPTGAFFRERQAEGAIEVAYYRRGSAASGLSVRDLDASYISSARYLHLTGILPALSQTAREAAFAAAEIARAAGIPVVFDPNYRRKLWSPAEARTVLRDLASRSDVVLAGSDEAELLTGEPEPEEAARSLLGLGPNVVVVKLGARGALAVSETDSVRATAQCVEVIDPVGAGDSFAAGYLAASLRGLPLAERLRVAGRCGALAATVLGDTGAFRNWEDVSSDEARGSVRR